MRRLILIPFVVMVCACSESTEEDATPGFDAGADTSSTAKDSGAAATDTGSMTGDAPATGGRVVINEIRSEDKTLPEYVELYNPTSKELDLSGWGVGGQKSDGTDDVPFAFPAGTKVAPGGYVVLSTNVLDDAACKTLAVTPCFFHDAGISGSRGETMRLVDPTGAVAEKATIPPVAAETGPTLTEPQSWGRLPNGTGEFAANKPTPGKANAAP